MKISRTGYSIRTKFEETINIETQVKSFYVRLKFQEIQKSISNSIIVVDVSDVIEYCNFKYNFYIYVKSRVCVKWIIFDVVLPYALCVRGICQNYMNNVYTYMIFNNIPRFYSENSNILFYLRSTAYKRVIDSIQVAIKCARYFGRKTTKSEFHGHKFLN